MFWNKPRPKNHLLGVKKGHNFLIQVFYSHAKQSNIYKLEADILPFEAILIVILLKLTWLKKSWIEWSLALFDSQQMVFGSRLIPKHIS